MAKFTIQLGGSHVKDGNICRFFACGAINGDRNFKDSGSLDGSTFTVSETTKAITINANSIGLSVTIPKDRKPCYYCFQGREEPSKEKIARLIQESLM